MPLLLSIRQIDPLLDWYEDRFRSYNGDHAATIIPFPSGIYFLQHMPTGGDRGDLVGQ